MLVKMTKYVKICFFVESKGDKIIHSKTYSKSLLCNYIDRTGVGIKIGHFSGKTKVCFAFESL